MGSRGWVQAAGLTGPTSSPLDRGPLGRRRRLLIADDDPDTRALYAWGLRAAGWFVTEAADGLEAVGLAAALRPHAIVMDLCMPGLGGADAVVSLRKDGRTSRIPMSRALGSTAIGSRRAPGKRAATRSWASRAPRTNSASCSRS